MNKSIKEMRAVRQPGDGIEFAQLARFAFKPEALLAAAHRTAQLRLHQGEQLGRAEGLGEVIVRAQFHARTNGTALVEAGQEDEGQFHCARICAQGCEQIPPAAARHHHVGNHQRGWRRECQLQGADTVVGYENTVAR